MEQKDIDIYEILKDEEYGTELYTPICGRVWHSGMANDKDSAKAIWTEDEAGREHFFDKNGKVSKEGEILLFPSKEMRDWSKFFKKGDVLEYKKENNQATCIFDSYEDNTTKLYFTGLYTLTKGKIWDTPTSWDISDWVKSDNPAAYIKTIEERLGGKLNRETLEIEKSAKPTFEIGKLYVSNEDGELTIIGKLIDKNEVELFNKHYAIWKKEKEAKEHRAFKPFDKVLVRSGDNCKWLPALFIRDRGVGFESRHTALPIHSGEPASFAQCISYDGNEYLAFTSDPF